MANEIRLRRNNIAGSITDNPLTAGSININSPGFVDLPVVDTTNHLILILDPLEANGAAEIVRVTSHLAANSTITVVRGAENSTPRQHPLGTTWFHGPVVSDWIHIVTSATRPAVPYEGAFIYETDTNKLVGFGGTDWAPRDAGGQLGYAEVTASQGSISAEVDLTGLSVAVTVGTDRRVKITGHVRVDNDANAGGQLIRIREGATELGRISRDDIAASNIRTCEGSITISPTPGSHTYKLTLNKFAGAGVLTAGAAAGSPNFILVEDIGAA